MADPIRCVYAMEDGYFCAKHSNAFYDASCRLLEGKPCEDQKLPKPMTNADRIRAMSDEELAEWLKTIVQSKSIPIAFVDGQLIENWIDWLRQEADE